MVESSKTFSQGNFFGQVARDRMSGKVKLLHDTTLKKFEFEGELVLNGLIHDASFQQPSFQNDFERQLAESFST